MTKILIVDDEPDLEALIRQKFRKQIREQEYNFLFALNGKLALETLNKNPDIDIVLSDINMPEMDGLTLLSKLRLAAPLVKTIIISAYGDMENIRTAMNRGAYDFITKPVNFDDLAITMAKTIDFVREAKETMQAIKENNILKMYVDENVLRFMNSKVFESSLLQNETIEASVAFIDICSFTAISEQEQPDVVVSILNNYFDIIVKEIINQNGIVDKFMGDCVMAVFKGNYHLDRAIETALTIRNKIDELPMEQNFHPKVSIGVNSGEMVSGNIGSQTLRRLDFTVIGDAVNIAQRLQSIADVGQILITEESYKKIKSSFKCNEIGPKAIKNKKEEIGVYEVLD